MSKNRHVVTRSIQGDVNNSRVEADSNSFRDNTDLLFICSDGVHDLFESIQIEKLLGQFESPLVLKVGLESTLKKEATDNYPFGIICSIQRAGP